MTVNITPAQKRYLDKVKSNPGCKFDGRARRPLEALEKLGLITIEFTLVPRFRTPWVEEFTCYPVDTDQNVGDSQ